MKNVIIYTNEIGGVSVCVPTGEVPIEQVQAKDIPQGMPSFIVSADSLPEADNDFFDAWEQTNGVITVSLEKAKAIAHDKRRKDRAAEFEPLDNIIAKQIPGTTAQEAEAQRQAIREKYVEIQKEIDSATTVEEIKAVLSLTL